MFKKNSAFITSILLFFFVSCGDSKQKKESVVQKQKKTIAVDTTLTTKKEETKVEKPFKLTEDNAIEFFFNYEKTLKKNKVKLTTSLGSFTIQLFDNVPYHRANFIYLTRQGYFNSTMFHRVVKGFIIQGGSSDNRATGKNVLK